MNDDDVVIAGAGALTAFGLGMAAQLSAVDEGCRVAGSLEGYDVAKALPDRRLLKAISFRDGIGLAALADSLRQSRYGPGLFPDERVGLFVGAPPSSALDAEPYTDVILAARGPSGRCNLRAFGQGSLDVKPTALLLGLPNNVLCYGSIMMGARGPNSNYTSGATSGLLAVVNAALRVRRGQLDLAVAGGYSVACNELHRVLGRKTRMLAATPAEGEPGDGAVFLVIERRATAVARGLRPLARYAAGAASADGCGLFQIEANGVALESAVRRALGEASLAPEGVGLVLTAAPPQTLPPLLAALERVFGGAAKPALGQLRSFGPLLEASGVLELALAGHLDAQGSLAPGATVAAALERGFPSDIDASRPYVLVVTATSSGSYVCAVVMREPG